MEQILWSTHQWDSFCKTLSTHCSVEWKPFEPAVFPLLTACPLYVQPGEGEKNKTKPWMLNRSTTSPDLNGRCSHLRSLAPRAAACEASGPLCWQTAEEINWLFSEARAHLKGLVVARSINTFRVRRFPLNLCNWSNTSMCFFMLFFQAFLVFWWLESVMPWLRNRVASTLMASHGRMAVSPESGRCFHNKRTKNGGEVLMCWV